MASSSTTPVAEIDKLLSKESTSFQRDFEIERILKAFRLNPYDVLDLDETATAEEIKKKYRSLSLFIHPDKASHPKAPEAFDKLKKAESEVGDKDKRENLDGLIRRARTDLYKANSIPADTPKDDERVTSLRPAFTQQLRTRVRDMLIDEELRRRRAVKMNLANEGLEAQKKEEEVTERKRKVEDDKKWEEGREQRVGNWRSFTNANAAQPAKKRKTKVPKVLGA